MLEAVIFGIFTGVMFFNQLWAVGTDETVCWSDFVIFVQIVITDMHFVVILCSSS